MIVDEILYEIRVFKEQNRGNPTVLKLSPESFAELVEYYGGYSEDITRFQGMIIEVSEYAQLELE